MIELKEVSKSFNNKEVLKQVSTVFETGKINLIIGASGSGKSVLMRLMVGLLKPDTGTISYDKRIMDFTDYDQTREIRQTHRDRRTTARHAGHLSAEDG